MTKFFTMAPNIFYLSIAGFCAYIQRCMSVLAQSMKYQITAQFMGQCVLSIELRVILLVPRIQRLLLDL